MGDLHFEPFLLTSIVVGGGWWVVGGGCWWWVVVVGGGVGGSGGPQDFCVSQSPFGTDKGFELGWGWA